MKNRVELCFPALAENECFARTAISAFLLPINPKLSTVSEIRTAVSEAVTNVVIHAGFPADSPGDVFMQAELSEQKLTIRIKDNGCGIRDVKQALQPFYTSCPDAERSGMGFSLMQSFMDGLQVDSEPGKEPALP